MVMKGTTLHNNVVVAAGAIVTKDMDQGTLAAGMPAKSISSTVTWAG
jgi:acetyltransferase-like isoleucine patch superfamily enzyme